ncbi:MAG: site-specific integrase [Deltaproteobacteria bacterium]|nr:site-specific integrase [Deltaproteobacteria bacterium]
MRERKRIDTKFVETTTEPGEYFDSYLSGFSLRITPNRAKSFCVLYRVRGIRRRLTIGKYGKFTVAMARRAAEDVLTRVAAGHDPEADKRADRAVLTFAIVAAQYYAQATKKSAAIEARMIAHKDVMPHWTGRGIATITSRDIVEMQNRVVKRGPIIANRTRSAVSTIFTYAIGQALLERNPCQGIPRLGEETSRERSFTEDEIRRLWIALEDAEPKYKQPFRLILMLAQRPGEVLGMKWCDVDLDRAEWKLTTTKSGNAHLVPLTVSAVKILRGIDRGKRERVWHYRRAGFKTESASNIVGRHAWLAATQRAGIQDAHLHDLRRTAATHLARLGTDRETLARILNHTLAGVTGVYDRFHYMPDKRAALERWNADLARITARPDIGRADVPVSA